jgi:hypothetical protein
MKNSRIAKLIGIGLLVIGMFGGVLGQTQGIGSIFTPPSSAAGKPVGSYALSDFESVNPYSGNLNFSLPLYDVRGRGEVGYTKKLVIEKSWNVSFTRYFSYLGTPSTGQPGQWNITDNIWNEPRNIQAPGILLGRKSRDRNPGGDANVCYTLSRISWIGEDKSEIEMRDELSHGTPNYHSG